MSTYDPIPETYGSFVKRCVDAGLSTEEVEDKIAEEVAEGKIRQIENGHTWGSPESAFVFVGPQRMMTITIQVDYLNGDLVPDIDLISDLDDEEANHLAVQVMRTLADQIDYPSGWIDVGNDNLMWAKDLLDRMDDDEDAEDDDEINADGQRT